MTAFEPLADQLKPAVVVVTGDVNSTMACAAGSEVAAG
jgi:UDP-N-acetylglucosamine 2-epimerase